MLSQQFRVFLTVAECGSFSGAAKKLLVTPASVMKHMNALEARIGAALLIRTHRGVALTAAGRSLYEDGRKMEALEKEAAARARAASSDGRIVIRVGSSLLNPSRVLTDLWPPFRPKYPMYRFRIIPYEDTREHILSVIASLGKRRSTYWLALSIPGLCCSWRITVSSAGTVCASRCPAIIPWRGKSASSRKTSTAKCCGW